MEEGGGVRPREAFCRWNICVFLYLCICIVSDLVFGPVDSKISSEFIWISCVVIIRIDKDSMGWLSALMHIFFRCSPACSIIIIFVIFIVIIITITVTMTAVSRQK